MLKIITKSTLGLSIKLKKKLSLVFIWSNRYHIVKFTYKRRISYYCLSIKIGRLLSLNGIYSISKHLENQNSITKLKLKFSFKSTVRSCMIGIRGPKNYIFLHNTAQSTVNHSVNCIKLFLIIISNQVWIVIMMIIDKKKKTQN